MTLALSLQRAGMARALRFIPRCSLPANTFLVRRKTGTLPQIRRRHAGTLIYSTVTRLAIEIQINKFRNPGILRALAGVLHYSLECEGI